MEDKKKTVVKAPPYSEEQYAKIGKVMGSIDQIPITMRGSGLTAFVDGIGDKSTSGSEGWTFKVDGQFANQGIGSTALSPPTTITWSYGDASDFTAQSTDPS